MNPSNISFVSSETARAAAFLQTEFTPSDTSPWSVIARARLDYYQIDPQLSADYLERITRLSGDRSSFHPAEKLQNLTLAPKLDVLYDI